VVEAAQGAIGTWEFVGKSRETFGIDLDSSRDLAAGFRTPNFEDAHFPSFQLQAASQAIA
jgi:hypothetical protein